MPVFFAPNYVIKSILIRTHSCSIFASLWLELQRSVQGRTPWKKLSVVFLALRQPLQTAYDYCKPFVKRLTLVVTMADFKFHSPSFVQVLNTRHPGLPRDKEHFSRTVNQLYLQLSKYSAA